ncbi:MAG: hypothetical protein HY655_08710 [Acidobacteria bacterium]|nr:hypothetical protein [Acidobacteriota bacterium]
MIRRVVLVTAISALLVIGSGITQLGVGAAQGTPQNPAPQAPAQSRPGMAEMKTSDAKLDALVKDMNAAAGEAKVTAMAAVANELVRQNKAMHERMGQMHQQMMGGRGMMMQR